ncbi:MAG: hypothetical protein KBS63_04785 [Clostridiales bacterium]|nr:hypothetical protein [Candidatus Crickella caballi]
MFASVILFVLLLLSLLVINNKSNISSSELSGTIINSSEYRGIFIPDSVKGNITEEELDELIEENGGSAEDILLRGGYNAE